MTSEEIARGGDSNRDDVRSLASTRTLGVAAHELALVFGKQELGIPLCIFGIAFAGVAIAIRNYDPGDFDLPVLLAVFGFAALLIILGVFTAILRKENMQIGQSSIAEIITINSQPISKLAAEVDITNYKALESVRDASSIEDLRRRLEASVGKDGLLPKLAPLDDKFFLIDLDVVRIALDRTPLSHK